MTPRRYQHLDVEKEIQRRQNALSCIIARSERKGKGKMSKRKWRDLIVRAIEDAIIIFLGIVAIWALAFMVSNGLSWLGVL